MESARWNKMSISEQILNIGGEIQRAVDRKAQNEPKLANDYLEKALEWIRLTKDDPKNRNRIEEITIVEDELKDYFSSNKYKNDKNSIMSYWNSFFSAIF
ncbi:hypothetical protein SAMN04487928_101154 [Butyrivibrio proteoclasticus]|uniref:Uncharacterized protein n=1 Tax=Butyrivibrio proteoclasticus TaxID=43305 RepID=A0A1I5PUT7_9FIRM|nr:hypothetical protein [Butyrivibrio proteoclasticus]SFP37792.1 hypothetical protein SAMN04487928_101154 [Butyrivibrio proteoclasticus]